MNDVETAAACRRHAETARRFVELCDRLLSADEIDDVALDDLGYLTDFYGIRPEPGSIVGPSDLFGELWESAVLEVYATARVELRDGVTVLSVTVVTGIGGPHVEVVISASDPVEDSDGFAGRAVASAYWGGETAGVVTYVPALSVHLSDAFSVFEGAR